MDGVRRQIHKDTQSKDPVLKIYLQDYRVALLGDKAMPAEIPSLVLLGKLKEPDNPFFPGGFVSNTTLLSKPLE